MRAASHSCDDGYIALNTFAILDAITVKNGCTFLHVKQSEKGADTRYMIREVTGVISKINPLDFATENILQPFRQSLIADCGGIRAR